MIRSVLLIVVASSLIVSRGCSEPVPWDDMRHVVLRRSLEDPTSTSCAWKPANNDDCPMIDGVRQCYYCSFTKCWKRSNARLDESEHCKSDKPEARSCPDLLEPFPVECPPGLELDWTLPENQVEQGSTFDIKATLKRDPGMVPVQIPCGGKEDAPQTGMFPHANVHGCVKTATTWWCSELVPAYQPDSVVTSPSQCFNETTNNVFQMQVAASTLEPPNAWTLYAHYYFYTDEQGNTNSSSKTYTKWHITRGATFLIQGRELALSEDIGITVMVLAGVVGAFSVITLIATLFWKKHWVIIASSTTMCYFISMGGIIGAGSVFTFNPQILSDEMCIARLWSVPLSFDFLVIPMMLKTWRVHKLFGKSFSKVRITNCMLLSAFFGTLVLECICNVAWMIVAPLKARKVFSNLDGNAWYMECQSDWVDYQNYFTIGSILVHLVPCLILTIFAYKVRLSFKYARINKKLHEFDESLYIMLALLNLTVVGLFVIIFQAIIESNPQAVTMMRTGGIAWIILFTVGLFFVPKYLRILTWDPQDGVPAAGSFITGSSATSSHSRAKKRKGRNVYAARLNDETTTGKKLSKKYDGESSSSTSVHEDEDEPMSSYMSSDQESEWEATTTRVITEDVTDDENTFAYTSRPSLPPSFDSFGDEPELSILESNPITQKPQPPMLPPRRPRPPSFLNAMFLRSDQTDEASAFSVFSVQDTEFSSGSDKFSALNPTFSI